MTGYVRNDSTNNIATGNVINASDLDGEFDAIVSAFHASTGHTHDGTAAEGAAITKVGPSQALEVTASALVPKTDNTLDLGTSTYEFKDLFIDGTANIDSLVADTADINGGTIDGVTITTPRITTGLLDTNGNEIVLFTATASAVNEITVANAATGNTPSIAATGTDTNISLNLVSKGSGTVTINGSTALFSGGALGTPASGTLTNATGLPIVDGTTGTLSVARGGTGDTTYTNGQLLIGNSTGNTLAKATLTAGTGISVTNGAGSITIAATNNGTVTSVATGSGLTGGTITSTGTISVATDGISNTMLRNSAAYSVIGRSASTTGDPADIAASADHQVLRRSGTAIGFGSIALNQSAAVTGTLPVANGGTGATSLTANNVILGNGTSAVQFVAPGASGNILTSNGTTWTSTTPAPSGVTTGKAIAMAIVFG